MIFAEVDIADAAGAIVAHKTTGAGFSFRKGHRLSAHEVDLLRLSGILRITVARCEAGDVGEDVAASALGCIIAGDGSAVRIPFTGRCNVIADTHGLAVIDGARIDRINGIDEAITVATVRPYARVEPGQLIATIKIIPFAVRSASLDACLAIAGGSEPPISVAAFRPRAAGLVQTRLPHVKDSVLQASIEVTTERLAELGSRMLATRTVDHRIAPVTSALTDLRAAGCDILLVIAASAICDRRDVIPAAIEAAGGAVDHLGMPVDPGNLLLLGRLGETPVIGLPGCARSPKLNGFDWVLRRILAELTVTRGDITAMGVGGLLAEHPGPRRPPHVLAPATPTATAACAPVCAIVLAAGRSTRMAPHNKLLERIAGKPLVLYAIEAALASRAAPVIVVVGHEAERVRETISGMPVTIVENPDYAAGLSTSIRAGLAAVPEPADGAVFLLGDMPRIRAEHIDRLIAAFDPLAGRATCVATHAGRSGHPVLWHRALFAELAALSGDVGGRDLFDRYADRLHRVAMEDDGVLLDVDDQTALHAVAQGLGQ